MLQKFLILHVKTSKRCHVNHQKAKSNALHRNWTWEIKGGIFFVKMCLCMSLIIQTATVVRHRRTCKKSIQQLFHCHLLRASKRRSTETIPFEFCERLWFFYDFWFPFLWPNSKNQEKKMHLNLVIYGFLREPWPANLTPVNLTILTFLAILDFFAKNLTNDWLMISLASLMR